MLGFSDHVTPVFEALLTDAAKLRTPEGYKETAEGVTDTETEAGITVKGRILLFPADVAIYTLCGPVVTLAFSVNVAVIVVELTTTTLPCAAPAPPSLTPACAVKFVPLRVTETEVPGDPEDGEMVASVGAEV
jgi:hypothetical protein